MITDREAATLRHIAKQPRRAWGLTHRDYFIAQNLSMPKRRLVESHTLHDQFGNPVAYYLITEAGRKELKEYDVHRSHPGVPPTKPAA